MDEYTGLSSYEYHKVIEAMTEQIKELTAELASVLCDVSRHLPEDERKEVRSLGTEDFSRRLQENEWYRLYVESGLEGDDPLSGEEYQAEISGWLEDEDEGLFRPSFYSRERLGGEG